MIDFIRRALRAMIVGMDEDPTITKDELAAIAGRYFKSASIEDIPCRLWIDTAEALSQSYVRACFDGRPSASSLCRLASLAEALDDIYGTNLVAVAYPGDRPWDEIEAAAEALQKVR